jgi:hypothetical protein
MRHLQEIGEVIRSPDTSQCRGFPFTKVLLRIIPASCEKHWWTYPPALQVFRFKGVLECYVPISMKAVRMMLLLLQQLQVILLPRLIGLRWKLISMQFCLKLLA